MCWQELQQAVSTGLMHDSRIYWWPILPRCLPGSVISVYPRIKEMASKQFRAAKARLLMPELPELGSIDDLQKARALELMALICDVFDISEPVLLRQLVQIVLLVIPSSDLCYQLCSDVLARGPSFLSRSLTEHTLKLRVFRDLLKMFLPAEEWIELERTGVLADRYLNLFFVNLFSPLLPAHMVLRIVDMFLLEGVIVLHRMGLGLFVMQRELLLSAGYVSLPPFPPPAPVSSVCEIERLRMCGRGSQRPREGLLLVTSMSVPGGQGSE